MAVDGISFLEAFHIWIFVGRRDIVIKVLGVVNSISITVFLFFNSFFNLCELWRLLSVNSLLKDRLNI